MLTIILSQLEVKVLLLGVDGNSLTARSKAAICSCSAARSGTEESMRIILYGLENDNNYRLTDMDGNIDTVMSGKELMENGIEIILSDPGSSAVIMISAEQ